jgi:hypothetical protein
MHRQEKPAIPRNYRATCRPAVVAISGLRILCCFAFAVALHLEPARGQERIDPSYSPTITDPEYPPGRQPLVLVDRGHNNFHTGDEHFEQLARLLRSDGYRVQGLNERLSTSVLVGADVLVIMNAIPSRDDEAWSLPASPAFTPNEIEALRLWVEGGGSLLLVADHMPFPGAIDPLARSLGIEFLNGFAIVWEEWDPLVFRPDDGSLPPHPVTRGRWPGERVGHVVTFVSGSAFRPMDTARCFAPLLVLGSGVVSYQPDRAWHITESTPRIPVEGWFQGATLEPGRGRIAIFAEAGMFAAQLVGPAGRPVGMNSPKASHNLLLLLNTFHWLSRAPGYDATHSKPC